jgi:hypothetical protein
LDQSEVERAEQSAIEEKPKLEVPLMENLTSKKACESRREAREIIYYYQKLIDEVYIYYTDLQNMTSVTIFCTAYDKLKLYIGKVIKNHNKLADLELASTHLEGDLRLILSEPEKSMEFFQDKKATH